MTNNGSESTTARPSILQNLRDEVRARRAARAEHKRLLDELATYTRPNEVDDLLATLERYDTAEAEQIRTILERNVAA